MKDGDKRKDKEKDKEKKEIILNKGRISDESRLASLLYTLTSFYAAYLCFRKNKGVSWGIIPALLFSPLYIIYVYATKDKKFKMTPF